MDNRVGENPLTASGRALALPTENWDVIIIIYFFWENKNRQDSFLTLT
jgi:hypothetical protein